MAWYEEFFDEDYIRFHLCGGDWLAERTVPECDFIVEALGLNKGDRVLDVCCGQGRHAVELARRGFDVVGADLSEYLLDLARKAAQEASVSVRFERCDMRELPWAEEFDAAINMYTSFGYFESDDDNEKTLHAIHRALRPGGRVLSDLPNLWHFLKVIPSGQRRWSEREGCVVLEEHTWDVPRGRLRMERTIIEPDGSRRRKAFDLRQYSHPEMVAMLTRVGFQWERTFGGVDMSDFGADSARMLLVARKPERQNEV